MTVLPVVCAVDCDRTLTGDDFVPDASALAAIARLRAAGIVCVLVTGRSKQDLSRHPQLPTAFDAFVLEGGASWGPWEEQWRPGNDRVVLEVARRIQAEGILLQVGTASFSCQRADLERVRALAGECALQPNVDRVDVLPPGIDKGMGLEAMLARMGLRGAHVIAIGDGENDVALFHRAAVGLAVANAHAQLKSAADEVLQGAGPQGLVEAADRILAGQWSAALVAKAEDVSAPGGG